MANTQVLLTLADAFPEAFADPEAAPSHTGATTQQNALQNNGRLVALLALADEFPEAFVDPEDSMAAAPVAVTESVAQPVQAEAEATTAPMSEGSLPPGYELSLHRTISTFTWGQIEAHLSYSTAGLASLWLVVGKSGTEIQSLCEAICRLTNLLLAHQVPVAEIVRQLRGIRGADSEGLGPHRILGLADAIGKMLQEAPATLTVGAAASVAVAQAVTAAATVLEPAKIEVVSSSDSQNGNSVGKSGSELLSPSLLDLSENNHRMGLCAECGSELQAMNGCSGGACQVCGYSSCS
ncbi:MAG: ribonucleotide reductase [Thermosynechococcaceae cyanobacterium]